MKRRSLTVLLCLLAIISLASVGFASWVISADDTEVAEGNIQVDTVTDERLEIRNLKFDSYLVGSNEGSMPSFYFGAPSSTETEVEYKWLKNESTAPQKLKITVTFNVYRKANNEEVKDLTSNEIKVLFTESGKFTESVKSGEEITETRVYAEIVNANPNVTYVENAYTFTIEVKWGSYFNNQNPFDFYNLKDPNKPISEGSNITWADEVSTKLANMLKALNEATYSVSITVSPKKSN